MSGRNGRRSQGGRKRGRGGARNRGESAEQRRRARAEQVFDPATSPVRAAALLREEYGDQPLEPEVAVAIAARADLARARAVAGAALAQEAGPMALSLAADVALMDGRPDEAERHAERALRLSDEPDLHLRLAVARADQGRLEEGIEVLDRVLVANPGEEELQLTRGQLLERLAEGDAPAGDGALQRFRDRRALLELQDAVATFVRSTPVREEAFAAALGQWVEAGATDTEELKAWAEAAATTPAGPEASTMRLMGEWAWLAPDPDTGSSLLEAFAGDAATPPEQARRAGDFLDLALWGLWEVDTASASPGVRLTELLSGARLYAEVPPELLAGLPRWSVLIGYVVPVDGVWRSGSGFVVATPLEGREVAHQLLDGLLDVLPHQVEEASPEIRALLGWAERTHEELDLLRLPADASMPSPAAFAAYQALVRSLAPGLVGMVRELQGTAPDGGQAEIVRAELDVPDPAAALQSLAGLPEFTSDEDDEDLVWEDGAGDWPRGSVGLNEGRLTALLDSQDDLEELVALLGREGHPATVRSRDVLLLQRETGGEDGGDDDQDELELDELDDLDDEDGYEAEDDDEEESVEDAVAIPEGSAEEVRGWLASWPEAPVAVLDDLTPLEAVGLDPAPVETLVRCLENGLDLRGLRETVDTAALRERLGLRSG
jgi:tetratricopeptide (TPR) repeat protein